MRRFLGAALAAVAAFGFASLALGADLPTKAPPLNAPPAYNWTGFYIGGFAGGAWGERDVSTTETGSIPPGFGFNGVGDNWGYDLGSSFIGGGTLGYNWQAPGSPLLVGVEGELGYVHSRGSAADPKSPNLDTVASARVGDWYGVLAGRLGWTGLPNWLIYIKGGAVWTERHAETVDACFVFPCGAATVDARGSSTKTGWTVGGGAEWMFAPHWSVKAEYLYLGIQESIEACGPGGANAAGLTFCWKHDLGSIHTAKLGVNYHF